MSATRCKWPTRRCPKQAKKRGFCIPHYDKARKAGLIPVDHLIDPTATRDRITLHLDCGRNVNSLWRASGVHKITLHAILANTGAPIRQSTADKIAATPLPLTATGCTRRIRALQRLGHNLTDISRAVGISHSGLDDALRRGRFTERLAARIDRVYEQMQGTLGTSTLAAAQAVKRGYAAPLAWNGRDIDNPDARPHWIPSGSTTATTDCGWCGAKFQPRKSTDRYCSPKHSDLAHNASKREQQAARRAAARTGQVAA